MTVCFFVYHRLRPGSAERFHDVPPSLFEDHCDRLERMGAQPDGNTSDGNAPWLRLPDGRGVALTFDDATEDHEDAARRLERRGWRGLFFVPAGRLGQPGRLSAAAVAAIAGRGHVIGSHGLTHSRFDHLPPDHLAEELAESRAILSGLAGKPVVWLAPPGGIAPPGLTALARARGYRFLRGVQWGVAEETAVGILEDGLLPAFLLSSRSRPDGVQRALDGRTLPLLGRIKDGVKRVLGERAWDRLRETVRR